MQRLVGINSLRFFAIAFIVIYHLFHEFLPGGFIAVEVFFCISGFLIISKLIRQVDSGTLSYRKFIVSRLKRLYPALLICVLLSLLIGFFIEADVMTGARKNTLAALTFSTNIFELVSGGSYENSFLPNIFEHTWFISLLFQFYLVIPLLLIIYTKIFRKRKDAIRYFGVSLLILSTVSMILMACYGGFFEMSDRAYFALDSHMMALCLGGAYAVYKFFRPRPPRTVKGSALVSLIVSVVLMCIMALQLRYDNPNTFIIGLPLTTILTVLMLACIIKLQRNIRERKKTMNVIRVFEGLGNLSYGIYLFHWPLYILLPHLLPTDTALWGYAIIVIIVSFICSSLVYELMSIKNLFYKIRHLRQTTKYSYLVINLGLVAIAVVTLVRAPQASSIADQLSAETNQESEELIAEKTSTTDYINASQILAETVETLDTQLKLAQDAKVLPAPSGSLAAANANVARVLVIGDSVTLGAKQAIEATIAKSFVDAKESRGIETATGILANYSATGKLPSIIVISLATNERNITESMLNDIVNVAGKGHKFIFVTAYAGPLQPRDKQNDTLKSYARKHKNVYIADWWEVSHGNWSLMYADHIHLNPSGRTAYANILSNVIRGMR